MASNNEFVSLSNALQYNLGCRFSGFDNCQFVFGPAGSQGQETNWEDLTKAGNQSAQAGDFKQAEKFLNKALESAWKLGEGNPRLVMSYRNLGKLEIGRTDFVRAEGYFKRALDQSEKSAGPEGLAIVSVLDDFIVLYRQWGAIDTMRMAELTRAGPGGIPFLNCTGVNLSRSESIPVLRLSRNSTGALFTSAMVSAKNPQESKLESLLRRTLAIREKARGPQDPETITNQSRLAGSLLQQDKWEEAEGMANDLLSRAGNNFDVKIGSALNSLGMSIYLYGVGLETCRHHLEDARTAYQSSESLVRRSLAIYERNSGQTMNEMAGVIGNLAMINETLHQNQEAEALYRRALSASDVIPDSDTRQLSAILWLYAGFLRNEKRPSEAAPLEARAKAQESKPSRP